MTTVMTDSHEGVEPITSGAGGVRRIGSGAIRLTVVADGLEVDVSMPAGLSVAALIPALSSLVDGVREPEDPPRPPSAPILSTAVGIELDQRLSLTDNGVREGDTLVFHRPGEISPPVFDDVSDAVAHLGTPRSWSASDSATAAAVVGGAALLGASWTMTRTSGWGSSVWTVVLAVLATVAACVCARAHVPSPVRHAARIGACASAFAAGVVAVPGDDVASDAVLAFALVAAVSVVTSMLAGESGRSTFTAVSTTATLACVAMAATALTSVPATSVAAVTAAVAVLASTWVPRLSASLAGIRLPPVPLADNGTRLDDSRRQGPPTRPSAAARAAAYESALSDVDVVAARARTARQYVTGYSTGLATVASTAAIVVATQGLSQTVDTRRLAFAALVSTILCFRARGVADRVQSAIAIASGTAVLVVVTVVGALVRPEMWVWWLSGMIGVLVVSTLIGVVAPGRQFTPVIRRLAELAELAAVASVVPLACWIVGAFSAVRGL
ncbi:MAG: type VII secretion integral membrane protein EccD [Rhodococcus sp. (in: high G+C Gram-positive bacteria)]